MKLRQRLNSAGPKQLNRIKQTRVHSSIPELRQNVQHTMATTKTRIERKLPFIPTDEEINQLIAGCGKKTATFLQVLKDTGAQTAEAAQIQWTEIEEKTCAIRINHRSKAATQE